MTPSKQIAAGVVANVTLGAEGCDDLPAFHAGNAVVTTWHLSPAELAEIQRTGRLHLVVYDLANRR